MPTIRDYHTHDISRSDGGIVSGEPEDVSEWIRKFPSRLFSAGIHPWTTLDLSDGLLQQKLSLLKEIAGRPQVAAIGETGLDALRGGSERQQETLLLEHIALSEHTAKPLVLHVVRRFNRIMELRRQMSAELTQPWIIHGFRGKPALALQLIRSATTSSPVYISLGAKFNPLTAQCVPSGRLLAESDDSHEKTEEIISRIAAARHEPYAVTEQNIRRNIHSLTQTLRTPL